MRRVLIMAVMLGGCFCPVTIAQSTAPSPVCSTQPKKLFCLVSNQLGEPSPQFQALTGGFSQAIGVAVSDLPLASPASGVIYNLDPKLNLPVPSDQTLGPILTQRPETVGRHKLYFAAVYQYFRFEDLDGISLKQIRAVTTDPTGTLGFQTNNRLDLKVHQATGYFTFGISNRVDISVAVPVLDVQERFTTIGTKYIIDSPISTLPSPIDVTNAGSASGIGDVVLAAKGTVWKSPRGGLAVGVEVRLPTGDALNFLGAGTIGVKPYAAFAYGRAVSVHANIGYQMNGDSQLVANNAGVSQHLPNRLFFSEGVDWGPRRWITVVADVLSERVFDANGITIGTGTINNDTFPSFSTYRSSYDRSDGSVGLKLKAYRNLIVTGNVLIKLDQGGLRTRLVPLGGLSYTF